MKLPPYTIPDHDADLWSCGRRLTGGGDVAVSAPSTTDAKAIVLHVLHEAGPSGLPTLAELVRRSGLTIDRARTALRKAGVFDWDTPLRHPDYPRPSDPDDAC